VNFFQSQEKAKRNTTLLVFLFLCAVAVLVALTNLLVVVFLGSTSESSAGLSSVEISLTVLAIIGIAIAYKYLSLKGGGRVIAEMLGGTLITSDNQNPQHIQLINVVEEMAIAAGMTVPPVYLIREDSINAFAAGFSQQDAVIGINQGTLDLLNRDELQGVVAHEFSHILNGDMNLNLRLIAILHGIVFIGMIGYGVLRGAMFQRKNGAAMLALGAGLIAIGFGGMFFGNLIKASVSRQREYLADASADQFTRLQAGIANALKKIGAHSQQSHMLTKSAEQASHMFFGSVLPKFSSGLMATHPPLDKRIRAIDPNWDGVFALTPGQSRSATSTAIPRPEGNTQNSFVSGITEQVGQINEASLVYANQFVNRLEPNLKKSSHDVFEARALIYALLLSQDLELRQKQIVFLTTKAEKGVSEHLMRILNDLDQVDHSEHLNLVLMATPTLKRLSKAQYRVFSSNIGELIVSDGKVDLFEWVLHRIMTQSLYSQFEKIKPPRGKIKNILRLEKEIAQLFSILASHSQADKQRCEHSYNEAVRTLDISLSFKHADYFDFRQLNTIMEKIRELSPRAKEKVISAADVCIKADNSVSVEERVLLQGICATLDCPLPCKG
jgi:Zn-dependent protease with chaperone function